MRGSNVIRLCEPEQVVEYYVKSRKSWIKARRLRANNSFGIPSQVGLSAQRDSWPPQHADVGIV